MLADLLRHDQDRPAGRVAPLVRWAEEPAPDTSLLELVERELSRSRFNWVVRPAVDAHQPWISAQVSGTSVPDQGWKIHVSSYEATAFETLERVLPPVAALGVPLKVLGSIGWLRRINLGGAGLSQVGKFITVYPHDDATAVDVATSLTEATRGLHGPRIPSDRTVEAGGVVHYRYGGFGDCIMQTRLGEVIPALVDKEGRLVPDHRGTAPFQPPWVEDPFRAAGLGAAPRYSSLVAGRYQPVMTLSQTPGVVVQLALDVEQPRQCILKRAVHERREPLRKEGDLLAQLASTGVVAQLYDVDDGEELVVVTEDLGTLSLEREVKTFTHAGRVVPNERIVELGLALADALDAVHGLGHIHGDVKPPNILLCEDGRLRLIDFDIAHPIGSNDRPPSAGTRGYTSPECREGQPAAVTDDVFAAGAVLYYLATGAEPSRAPDEDDLLARPPGLINPRVSAGITAVVGRCLARSGSRFATARGLREALVAAGNEQTPIPAGGCRVPAEVAARQVIRAANSICSRAEPFGRGVAWRSLYHVGKGLICRDVNAGTAGTVLALAEIVDELRISRHAAVLHDAATALSEFAAFPGDHPAGLYVGEAGVAAAVLRAGQVLDDRRLVGRAVELARASAELPIESPDLFHGAAGRLLVHLLLWDETGEREDLDDAIKLGGSLLEERCPWRIPAGYGGLSGKSYLGYAHGAAGIADVLLDLYEATADSQVVEVASEALSWLERQAVPSLDDGSGVAWPLVEGGPPHPPFWCHGATGIGRALLHGHRLGLLPNGSDLVRRAARSAALGARWSGPTLCHGLAGNAEFLLDVDAWTEHGEFLDEAHRLMVLAGAFAREADDGCTWVTEPPHQITPDYLVGYAGIGLVLLRLARPDRPFLMSRAGFRSRR